MSERQVFGLEPVTEARRKVRRKIDRARGRLLAGVAGPLVNLTSSSTAARAMASLPDPRALLIGVYWARRGSMIRRLIDEPLARQWPIRLWALDETVRDLAAFTIGTGPGGKIGLFNRLLDAGIPDDVQWVVTTDDDLVFRSGSMALMLKIAARSGFVLCQPSHVGGSHFTYGITLRRPASVARLTTFVDVGPLVAIRSSHASELRRLGPDPGMGWGLGESWGGLVEEGHRLGIVDLVSIQHLEPPGSTYGRGDEQARLRKVLRDRGARTPLDLQRTLAVWRPWQSRPPWLPS